MIELKLVYPIKKYENKAFEFINEFVSYKSEINGTGGLYRYDDYDEWLKKVLIRNRFSGGTGTRPLEPV